MPWISTNLSAALGGISSLATEAIEEVQGKLDLLNAQVSKLNSTLSTAVSTITSAKSTLTKLSESGFYMITLTPQKGSWSSRLSSASNAPPTSGYCCGVATISVAPDLDTVTSAYGKIVDAVKKPMTDAKSIYDAFDFSDYSAAYDLDELAELAGAGAQDWADLFTTDVWQSATLGDIFGGYMEGMTNAANALAKDAKSVMSGVNQASKSISAVSKGLDTTKTLISQMEATGVYTVVLSPESGNYLSRLKSETGAPSTSSQLCTAGYVCVAVAADLTSLATKFETLASIVC